MLPALHYHPLCEGLHRESPAEWYLRFELNSPNESKAAQKRREFDLQTRALRNKEAFKNAHPEFAHKDSIDPFHLGIFSELELGHMQREKRELIRLVRTRLARSPHTTVACCKLSLSARARPCARAGRRVL